MNPTKVAVVALVVTAFICSIFLNLGFGYIHKFKFFSLYINTSQIYLSNIISPTIHNETIKLVFNDHNGIFPTNHVYSQNSKLVENHTIRLAEPLFYTPYKPQTQKETNRINVISNQNHDQEKLIVVYTTYYGNRWLPQRWSPDGNLFFLESSEFTCPKKCVFTDNKNFTRMADAVLFGVLDSLYNTKDDEQIYPKLSERKKDQIWIASTYEPPLYHDAESLNELNYLFNWTATYRVDSEIYWPYGFFYKLNQPKTLKEINLPNATVLKSKKLAASLISNCLALSGRNFVLDSLKQYMKIDSYGKCGNETCPDDTKCREYLGSHYKFFMAFENSLCQDYVTEKFFASFSVGMVPVTFGLGNYAEIAPPHSYINALDFPNTKALAEFLLHLDKNDEEYLAYFDWRRNYAMEKAEQNVQFCALCLKVWQPIRKKIIQKGFDDWWIMQVNTTVFPNTGSLGYKFLSRTSKGCVTSKKLFQYNYISM